MTSKQFNLVFFTFITFIYLRITVYFVDKMFRLHRWTSFCTQFSNKYTSENIAEVEDLGVGDSLELTIQIPK